MTQLDNIQKRYEIGYPIFEELFKLNDSDLKEKLKSILNNNENAIKLLNEKYDCTRIIKNEKPDEIKFSFYDQIEITWLGIYWNPEHGHKYLIREFDEHFKL